jgi:hypothetical protein
VGSCTIHSGGFPLTDLPELNYRDHDQDRRLSSSEVLSLTDDERQRLVSTAINWQHPNDCDNEHQLGIGSAALILAAQEDQPQTLNNLSSLLATMSRTEPSVTDRRFCQRGILLDALSERMDPRAYMSLTQQATYLGPEWGAHEGQLQDSACMPETFGGEFIAGAAGIVMGIQTAQLGDDIAVALFDPKSQTGGIGQPKSAQLIKQMIEHFVGADADSNRSAQLQLTLLISADPVEGSKRKLQAVKQYLQDNYRLIPAPQTYIVPRGMEAVLDLRKGTVNASHATARGTADGIALHKMMSTLSSQQQAVR